MYNRDTFVPFDSIQHSYSAYEMYQTPRLSMWQYYE